MKVSNIDLRLLRVFHALAENGGFAGAQSELGLTPSTLSIHLSNLEQRLGVTLCDRGRGGFRLTDKGERVFESTKQLFAALEEFHLETSALRSKLVGALSIGLADNTVTDHATPISGAIRRFAQRDHDVHLRLVVDRPSGLNHALLEGRLNLAVAGFPHHVAGVHYEDLYTETHLLFAARGHDLFGQPDSTITAEAITRSRFVGRAYSLERDMEAVGNTLHKATVENMEAQAHLILSGCYIGFLPEHYGRLWTSTGEMRAINPAKYRFMATIQLAMPVSGKPNQLMLAFRDDLRAANVRAVAAAQ